MQLQYAAVCFFFQCATLVYVDVNTEEPKHYTCTPELHISRQDVKTRLVYVNSTSNVRQTLFLNKILFYAEI